MEVGDGLEGEERVGGSAEEVAALASGGADVVEERSRWRQEAASVAAVRLPVVAVRKALKSHLSRQVMWLAAAGSRRRQSARKLLLKAALFTWCVSSRDAYRLAASSARGLLDRSTRRPPYFSGTF